MNGKFDHNCVHMSFSFSDFKESKQSFKKFSDEANKYIEVFGELPQTYKVDQKGVTLLFNQTLTSNERKATLQATITFRVEYRINFRGSEDRHSGVQLVPTEPKWSLRKTPTGLLTRWETFSDMDS